VPNILSLLERKIAFCQCKLKQGKWATKPPVGERGFLTTNIQKKSPSKEVEASQGLLFFLFSWELFSEEELFFPANDLAMSKILSSDISWCCSPE